MLRGRVDVGKVKVTLDPVTGDLVKPATWSDDRFMLFKMMRIKESVFSSPL